jgi:hypothetical protein
MAASFLIHSWSPHADNSAFFLVTSRSQLALYLLVRPFQQLRTHPVATGGELLVRLDSLTSMSGTIDYLVIVCNLL